MRIEIVCTGDEVLSGKTVNSNFSHISRRLEEVGLSVVWGTTVGDDRERLLEAFRLAATRADAVIVNGGLGPTVDDLSQEVAALAAGDTLALRPEWLDWMEQFYRRRNRPMPPNNRKQAMLPTTAELIDNPVGTACGFALDIGKARFFFTPGVPREMRKMLDEQIIPRLLAQSGMRNAFRLKRFHSFGVGESRADEMLKGIEDLVPGGGVKLGFQAHYPELETKLVVRGTDEADVARKLTPLEAEVRRHLGNFILAEDDSTLEKVINDALVARDGSLSTAEMFTSGGIASRMASMPDAERLFRRGVGARALGELREAVGLPVNGGANAITPDMAVEVARALRERSHASHALGVLIDLDDGTDRVDFGGTICIGIVGPDTVSSRQARLIGGRDWVRLGAAELGLDCLRRHLLGLPVEERIDFEKR